jgi:hypothetical protein
MPDHSLRYPDLSFGLHPVSISSGSHVDKPEWPLTSPSGGLYTHCVAAPARYVRRKPLQSMQTGAADIKHHGMKTGRAIEIQEDLSI